MKAGFLLLYLHFIMPKTIDGASVKAPLDIISLEDITPEERQHLQYLNNLNEQREKRSSHGFLSAIGSGIKLLGQGSASASSHSSGYYDHPPPPEPEHHDGKSFDFWGLKKSVLNTLLQAAKALKGAAIALTGKLIKGSGYLVSAKGKLISSKGEAVSEFGKKIAASAVLSPPAHYHHSGYSDHHEEYHSAYGPSGHHDVDVAPSAPAIEYDHPSHLPSKYPSFEDALHHETLHGLPSGILILKKIPRQLDAQESVKIPDFQPLKPREPEKSPATPMISSLLTNIFTSASHSQPQTPEITHTEQYSKPSFPKTITNDKDEDFPPIKPVVEEELSPNKDKQNNRYQIQSLQQQYNMFPNELIDIPQDEYSDFSTHPGFYINNLAAGINSAPTFSSFPTQMSTDYLSQFNLNSQHPSLLQDPRYLKQDFPTFHPPSLAHKGLKLKPPLPFQIKHNHVKRAPSKPGPIRIKSPTNYELIKSLSFQLVKIHTQRIMPLTLYSLLDGPPSVACRMALKALNVDYNLVNMDYTKFDHLTEEYAKKNPQKEIPVLDDNGFYLSESNAILQYLVDKYGKDDTLYPKDVKARAIVNQRLSFNLVRYYRYIEECILPIFFDYERTDILYKKVKISLDVFNTYLKRQGTKYSAGDNLTIADLQFCASTMCLEAINFDFSQYSHVTKWYETFKAENPELWAIAEEAMKILSYLEKNPPDMSGLSHPLHPIKRTNA
ncbi:hypothetical protein Trydic_g1229 [Trypoxylus dichotomus]